MIGDAGDGGGKVQIQLLALIMLLADRVLVLEDGGGEGVDIILGDIVPGDDHGAYGHGVGVHGSGALATAVAAAGGQGQEHEHRHCERKQSLFHNRIILFSFFCL